MNKESAKTRSVGFMLMITLAFGLDSLEQFGVRSFKLVSKLRRCWFLFGDAVNFRALDSLTERLLNRRQNLVTPFCILPVLLVVTEPKRRGNANEHQN